MSAKHEPIFVVGTGRSGTTLLRMMLNAHPRIYLTHEASFYLTRAPRRATASEWLDRYLLSFSCAWLGIPENELRAEVARGPGPGSPADAMSAVMRCKARRYGKERFGDKTPMHGLHLGELFADHPDARVIHIVRDPRDAVASLGRMPWASCSTGLNSLFCDRQVKAVGPFGSRVHEVRLEDLLSRPEEVMRTILNFVGEPWDDGVLDHEHHAAADDVPPFPWFAAASGNVRRPEGPPTFLRELSPEWIRIVEAMNSYGMQRYGYARATLAREPAFSSKLRARLNDLPAAIASVRRVLRAVSLSRKDAPPDAQMEALLHLNPRAWEHYPGFRTPSLPAPRSAPR